MIYIFKLFKCEYNTAYGNAKLPLTDSGSVKLSADLEGTTKVEFYISAATFRGTMYLSKVLKQMLGQNQVSGTECK